jgi:hypothetical protein
MHIVLINTLFYHWWHLRQPLREKYRFLTIVQLIGSGHGWHLSLDLRYRIKQWLLSLRCRENREWTLILMIILVMKHLLGIWKR